MENRTKTLKLFEKNLKNINPEEYPDIKETINTLSKQFEVIKSLFESVRKLMTEVPEHLQGLNLITDEQVRKALNYSKSEIEELLRVGENEDFEKFCSFYIVLQKYRLRLTKIFSKERKDVSLILKYSDTMVKGMDNSFCSIISDVNKIDRHIKLMQIRRGGTSMLAEIIDVPILLNEDEKCYIKIDGVDLYEDRAIRDTAGSYDGFSFRIARGVSYRIGGFNARGESHMEKRLIDKGSFYVTSKRYIFDGSTKNIEGELKKIISVEAYSDGIKVSRANKRDEVFVGDIDGEHVGAVISGLINNMGDRGVKKARQVKEKQQEDVLSHDDLVEPIKALLSQVQYEGRVLTVDEKEKLLERWRNSVESNKKRMNQVCDSDLNGFVIGLKYGAICDDRSCDFCKGHNGEMLKIDDPRIKENTPPIHLGCRCLWVPITKFEGERENIKFHWSDIAKPDFSLITF